jgi:hypothetical protein
MGIEKIEIVNLIGVPHSKMAICRIFRSRVSPGLQIATCFQPPLWYIA